MEQQVLGGRYLLKDKVGSGGMATVFRAQDQVLDRTVAVKIMLPQYAADATFAARFKQEAQAAAGLQSPYIVGVYDWGKDGDTYYIVMEYLRGTDLKSGIRSHGALDPKKVAQIGSQICAALSVAHKHEIVHRDIKPQNIMVQPDGNIKVMDFGIARAKNSHLTQDNNVLGTAHYVSPEQTRGQELGPTSDLYSLGVVMYECATGQVPFDGDDAISVALKQVNELPVPPSQINPGVDADLERIILKCMEKDPANRFQTADELRQVLNSYLAGRTVDVPEPTRVIGAGGAGATETRVMSDQTQAMVRPAVDATRSSARGGGAMGPASGGTGSYEAAKKGGKGKIAVIVVAAIAVIAAIAVFASGLLSNNSAQTVDVPSLLGMDQATAEQTLEAAGLSVGNTDRSYNDSYAEGQICDQLPSEGTTVEVGSTVDITVSRGAQPVTYTTVPRITGMTEDEARAALAAEGLTGSLIATEENEADEGTVFEQSPSEGEQIEEGGTVEYKVSSGPGTTEVPNVTGYTESAATSMLSEAGFGVSGNTQSYSDTVGEGRVISYSPAGQQAPGTQISLVISLGPEPEREGTVPDVRNYTQSDAVSTLESAGFLTSVTTQSSSSVPAGQVISYSPSGTQTYGTTITIVVSTGPSSSGSSNGNGNSSGSGGTGSDSSDDESGTSTQSAD